MPGKSVLEKADADKKQRTVTKITSWEQLNHILYDLTERLIELGAPRELKPTVLQIWCSYLRHTEVAFFSKRNRSRPRVGLYNQRNDLNLIFNKTVPRTSYKAKKHGINTTTARGKRKLSQKLLEEEYDTLQLSQSTDLESTLSELSSSQQSSSATNVSPPFQFSSQAKKRLKEELHIDDEHIQWHEQEAPIDASCHSITALHPSHRVSSGKSDDWSSMCRKSVIISILALALNQVCSQIQIGDVLRWIEEGHLPFNNLEQLLPDELDAACLSETLCHMSAPNNIELVRITSFLARDLGILPVQPDLTEICRRYLGELALPLDLEPYIVKLIAISPKIKQGSTVISFPAYEQHAMKYILFVMKLLFCLDNVMESKMDALSADVNRYLHDTPKTHPQLFVWHEWQRYVAMRRVILEQVHYPTFQQRANGRNVSNDVASDLLLDHSESYFIPDEDNTTGYRAPLVGTIGSRDERGFRNVHLMITSTTDKFSKESLKRNICFDHNLQPQRSYLAALLEMQQHSHLGVYIPDYMRTDHCKRTAVPFVSPMPLKKYLLDHQRVRLQTKAIKPSISQIHMEKFRKHIPNSMRYLEWREFTRVLEVEDGELSSNSDDLFYVSNILDYIDARDESQSSTHEELLHKVLGRNLLENIQRDLNASMNDAAELIGENEQESSTFDPFKSNPPIKEKLPGEDLCNETVKIGLSNFHYWIRSVPHNSSARKFSELGYMNAFPTSFQFLLSEAAYVTRSSPYELYGKLNELEKYLFKSYEQMK
ncbi:TATA box-binding protein-associated factor RNA polymerase I subunit B-like [Anopheles ziemanni]|uniref:TATA box-binding protein-associated factor RNA polymerase I subunit B-like n=1 Tax=Anopheles ziemanni TaxID=345580 RepID=UPI00265E4C7C|nr:TATA box-binding protein-associated factor RNA polymerase I subunit B-like [Anopheles ziemanni]